MQCPQTSNMNIPQRNEEKPNWNLEDTVGVTNLQFEQKAMKRELPSGLVPAHCTLMPRGSDDPTVHSPGVLQPPVLLLGFSAFEGSPERCRATGSRRDGAAFVSTVVFLQNVAKRGREAPVSSLEETGI